MSKLHQHRIAFVERLSGRFVPHVVVTLACVLSTLGLLFAVSVRDCVAQNIDLVTLPKRNTVQLTIYNSQDLTMVRETRFLTLKQGMNQLQFSWAGTLIDPTSVDFKPLRHQTDIELLDTVFLGTKSKSLIWNVRSEVEGEVPVEVSYFTSSLSWSMDYVVQTNSDETKLDLSGYVRVFNKSGEEYEDAEIRLIVGNINLVEKIAALATTRGVAIPESESSAEFREMARDVTVDFMSRVSGSVGRQSKAKIIKEGVSEYFMFTVEGTETVPNGWSKRMEAVTASDADFEIVYRMRRFQYGPRPVRFLVLKNDPEHKLGTSPLPNGRVRVFRKNGRDGISFLGQQNLNYVPVSAPIEANLGPDDLVVYDRTTTGTRRSNFAHHHINKKVIGWDQQQDWFDRIRNFHKKPIQFELQLKVDGDARLTSENDNVTSFSYNTAETSFEVPAGGVHKFPYMLNTHLGTNAKQARLRIN